MRAYADMMGHQQASQVLQQILDEEGRTDKLLTQIAEKSVNIQAEDMGMQQGQGMQSGGTQSGGSRSRSRSGNDK